MKYVKEANETNRNRNGILLLRLRLNLLIKFINVIENFWTFKNAVLWQKHIYRIIERKKHY